ncbi:uncharacterized protein LOC134431513 [Melospiza melodia melodia]|uniref:uncharacterized protein LOC134431513 n=1 Tax=Melospiza melodia melodia TaxID=1914991 RepID=UPI002FD3551F
MRGTKGVCNSNDYTGKTIFLLILLLTMGKPLTSCAADVIVTPERPVVGVMQDMDVNLTCIVTNNQSKRAEKIRVTWGGNAAEGKVVTYWNEDEQHGNSTLCLKKVSQSDMGRYWCNVTIGQEQKQGMVKLRVVPWRFGNRQDSESIEVVPYKQVRDKWAGHRGKMNCEFTFKPTCTGEHQVKWWKKENRNWRFIDSGYWWGSKGQGRVWLDVGTSKQSEGTYLCLLMCGLEGSYGLRVWSSRVRRELQFNRTEEQENLIVGLVRDFGKMQNVTKITACLPLPQAAGEPIPWGIIPIPDPPIIQNLTQTCYPQIREKLKKKTMKEWSTVPKPSDVWQCRANEGRFEPKSGLYGGLNNYGWCYDVQHKEIDVKVTEQEWVCQNSTSTASLWDNWETVWGQSLLEHYTYLGEVEWCVQWTGSKNATSFEVSNFQTSRREWQELREGREYWNCSKLITCDTPEDQISIAPVRVLVKWGCECRKLNHTIAEKTFQTPVQKVSCMTTTIRSPGKLVWVLGHGQWTTHLPLDGPVTQITLGIPTLCPFWKKESLYRPDNIPVKQGKTRVMKKREDIDRWHAPSTGVKLGWALESLFAPIASYRNREMLYNLLGQTERLAAATKKGFKDFNLQLQATSKMTVQNRMTLDLLLLKEHGVCGYLSGRIDHCCIHIPNVTKEVEKDISELRCVQQEAGIQRDESEHNWIEGLFNSWGLNISGWLSSLIQYVLMFGIVILLVWCFYKCLLSLIQKEVVHTRMIIKALTRPRIGDGDP